MKRRILLLVLICALSMRMTFVGVNAENERNILIEEDFEGASPAFVGGDAVLMPKNISSDSGSNSSGGCEGSGSGSGEESSGEDNVNNYLEIYRVTANEHSGYDYGSSAQVKVDSMPENFILTADIYKCADNTQPFIFEYFADDKDGDGAADAYGGAVLQESDVSAEQWYTLTLTKTNGKNGTATFKSTLVNKKTGLTTTPAITRTANVSGRDEANRFMFRVSNMAGGIHHWLIDNVVVEKNFDVTAPVTKQTVNTVYDGEKIEHKSLIWTVQNGVNGTVDTKGTSDKTDDDLSEAIVTPTARLNSDGNILATTEEKAKLQTNVPYGIYLYSEDNNEEGNPLAVENFTQNHDFETRLRYEGQTLIIYYTGTHRFYLLFDDDSKLGYNNSEGKMCYIESDMGCGNWINLKLSIRNEDVGTIYIDDREIVTYKLPEATAKAPYVQYLVYKADLVHNVEIQGVRLTSYDTNEFYITSVNHHDSIVEGENLTLITNLTEGGGVATYFVNGVQVGSDGESGLTLPDMKAGVYDIYAECDGAKTEPIRVFVEKREKTAFVNAPDEIICGASADVSISASGFEGIEKVEYYASGRLVASSEESPYYASIENLKVGTVGIYAKIYCDDGTIFSTHTAYLEVNASGVSGQLNISREYEIDYEYNGLSDGYILLNDGYFTIDFKHNGEKINYRALNENAVYDGMGRGIGAGNYKIVVTSGYAEVYYNGQFAFSTFLPYTYNEENLETLDYGGVDNVNLCASGVKAERFHIDWDERTEIAEYNADFDRFYSAEFDKLDTSAETFVVYDGEYQAKLIFDERGITAISQQEDYKVTEEYLLSNTITPGYYRLTVAKGLVQLFVNNEFVNSFRCPFLSHKKGVLRNVSNPKGTTFVAVKNTDDVYYHSEDFEGTGEFEPLEYFSSEQEGFVLKDGCEDPFVQQLVTEGDNTYLKLTDEGLQDYVEQVTDFDCVPVGDFNLNVSADNPTFKWRARADGNGEIHFIARHIQKGVMLSFGYDFAESEWRLAKYTRKKTSSSSYDGVDILVANSAELDTDWHNYELIMKNGDVALFCDGEKVIEYSGLENAHGRIGFGVSKGATLCVDDIEYSGEGKVSAGFSYISVSGLDSKDFHYNPSYGGVVAASANTNSYITQDNGKTWELLKKGFYNMTLNTMSGGFMASYHAPWTEKRSYVIYYPKNSWENGGSFINGKWATDDLVPEPEWFETADCGRSYIPSRLTQVQDGKYKGRVFFSRGFGIDEKYGGTAVFYTDADILYDPKDTSYYDGINPMSSDQTYYPMNWKQSETQFTYENTGINAQEAQIVDMPNDVIRYFARTDTGFLCYADSFDGGETFDAFKPSQLISTLCSFDVIRDPDNPSHYYAVFEYDATTSAKHPDGQGPRTRIALAVSYDAMKNWHYVMDIEELTDDSQTSYTACNHGMRVIDGVVYIAIWTSNPGYSKIFAVDTDKIKSLLRFTEVHDKVEFNGNPSKEYADESCIIPKINGKAEIYGETVTVETDGENYDRGLIEKIFGVTETESGIFDYYGVEIRLSANENGKYSIKDAANVFSKHFIETTDAYIFSNSNLSRLNIYLSENQGIEKSFKQDDGTDFLNSLNVASQYGLAKNIESLMMANQKNLSIDVSGAEPESFEKMVGFEYYDIEDVEKVFNMVTVKDESSGVKLSTIGNGFENWTALSVGDALEYNSYGNYSMIKNCGLFGSGNLFGTTGFNLPENYTLEFEVKLEAEAETTVTWENEKHKAEIRLVTREEDSLQEIAQIIVPSETWTHFSISPISEQRIAVTVADIQSGNTYVTEISPSGVKRKPGLWFETKENSTIALKNVRVYSGVSQFVSEGTVCLQEEVIKVPVYTGTNNLFPYSYICEPTAPVSKGNDKYMVTIFDAKNSVKGMPLNVHISGGAGETEASNYVETLSILCEDEIFNEWYSYKIVGKQIFGTRDMDTVAVYRKKKDSEEEYTEIRFVKNNGGRISSGIGNIRFGYRVQDEVYSYGYDTINETPTVDLNATVWEVKNVSVFEGQGHLWGYITQNNGKMTAELEVIAGDKTAETILSIYKDGVFLSLDNENLKNGEGNVTLNVDFDSDELNLTGKILLWRTLSEGVPLIEAITYDVQ